MTYDYRFYKRYDDPDGDGRSVTSLYASSGPIQYPESRICSWLQRFYFQSDGRHITRPASQILQRAVVETINAEMRKHSTDIEHSGAHLIDLGDKPLTATEAMAAIDGYLRKHGTAGGKQ